MIFENPWQKHVWTYRYFRARTYVKMLQKATIFDHAEGNETTDPKRRQGQNMFLKKNIHT
jgi:hypothetical protein